MNQRINPVHCTDVFLSFFLMKRHRNGREGTPYVVLTLSLLLTGVCASSIEQGTTSSKIPGTISAIGRDNNKVTDRTGQTSGNVTTDGGDCKTYIWMTVVAIINTFFLLMLLAYIAHHIHTMNEKKAFSAWMNGTEMKKQLKRLADSISDFPYYSHLSQPKPHKADSPPSNNNSELPQNEDFSEVNSNPSPNQRSKTNSGKNQYSPKPTMPTTSPPCPPLNLQPPSPCSRLYLQPPHPSQPHNSHLQTGIDSKQNSPLPPLPLASLPPFHISTLQSQDTDHLGEEEDDYDYLEIPTATQEESQATCHHEVNEKEKANKWQDTTESKGEEHEYEYIKVPIKPSPPLQHQAKGDKEEINPKEKVIHKSDDSLHSQRSSQLLEKMKDDS